MTTASTAPSTSASIAHAMGDGTTQYTPTKWTRRAGVITCLGIASLVAFMLIGGVIRANNRPDRLLAAQQDLQKALTTLPFTARLPKPIPSDAKLVGVHLDEPDKHRGPSIYGLETTYTVIDPTRSGASSDYIRVWQTNDVYVRKTALDPLGQRLNPTKLDGNTWFRRNGESEDRAKGVSYTTRFADNITMVVSGPNEKLVVEAIHNLAKVP